MKAGLLLTLAAATVVALLAGDTTADPTVISAMKAGGRARLPVAAAENRPIAPAAMSTPAAPGATEDVHLRGGVCTPVFTTYPDGVPIGTIAEAVSPPGILEVLWDFEDGMWLGYSPLFPEVGDLTTVGFLDIVFLCVGGSGPDVATFTRPLVWGSSGPHESAVAARLLSETGRTTAALRSRAAARRSQPRASSLSLSEARPHA